VACSEDAHSSRHTERSGNARRYRASREGFVGLLRRSAHRMALGPGANCRVRPQATNLCSRARERSRRLLSLSVPPARAELSICGSILCTCGRAPGSCCLRMRCGTLDTWASPPWKLIPIQMLNRSTLLVARFALASKLHPSPGSRIEHVHSCVSQRVQPCKLTRLRWAFEQRLESWIARLSVAIGRVKFCLAGGSQEDECQHRTSMPCDSAATSLSRIASSASPRLLRRKGGRARSLPPRIPGRSRTSCSRAWPSRCRERR